MCVGVTFLCSPHKSTTRKELLLFPCSTSCSLPGLSVLLLCRSFVDMRTNFSRFQSRMKMAAVQESSRPPGFQRQIENADTCSFMDWATNRLSDSPVWRAVRVLRPYPVSQSNECPSVGYIDRYCQFCSSRKHWRISCVTLFLIIEIFPYCSWLKKKNYRNLFHLFLCFYLFIVFYVYDCTGCM